MPTRGASVSSSVARGGSTRARAGASTTDTYRPAPGGENHVWPRGPGPAVCSSATMTTPSASSFALRSSATSLVDEIVGTNSKVHASRPRRRRARAVGARESSPPGLAASEGFDFKADVDGWRGVRQRADRNEIGAGGRKLRDALERDAAGDFDLRAPTCPRDRLTDVGGGHVVHEDGVGAGGERRVHLVEPLGL